MEELCCQDKQKKSEKPFHFVKMTEKHLPHRSKKSWSFEDFFYLSVKTYVADRHYSRIGEPVLTRDLIFFGRNLINYPKIIPITLSYFSAALELYPRYLLKLVCLGTDVSGQTVHTQIRLLPKKQSDLGLHCLLFDLIF